MLRYVLSALLAAGSAFAKTSSLASGPVVQTTAPSTAEDWVRKGQEQNKAGQYREASLSFEEATRADRKNVEAKLGLANACVKLWMKGGISPTAENNYFRARNTLLDLLDQQPDNKRALSALSRISLQRANSMGDRKTRNEMLDEARIWDLRLIAIDPNDVGAHYALGVIAWTRCIGPESQSHIPQNVKVPDADVPPEVQARLNYRAVCEEPVEEGIWHLTKALEVEKNSDASMGYLGALYNMKAGYEDSPEDAQRDRESSSKWTAKAEALRKSRAAKGNPTPPNR